MRCTKCKPSSRKHPKSPSARRDRETVDASTPVEKEAKPFSCCPSGPGRRLHQPRELLVSEEHVRNTSCGSRYSNTSGGFE